MISTSFIKHTMDKPTLPDHIRLQASSLGERISLLVVGHCSLVSNHITLRRLEFTHMVLALVVLLHFLHGCGVFAALGEKDVVRSHSVQSIHPQLRVHRCLRHRRSNILLEAGRAVGKACLPLRQFIVDMHFPLALLVPFPDHLNCNESVSSANCDCSSC